MKHHNSAEDYIRDIMFTIMEADMVAKEPLPSELLEYWGNEIYNACQAKYELYIKGEVDDYRLDEVDITDLLEEANRKMVGDLLGSLVDKGAVEMSVGEDGEIRYKATDKGKSML